MERPAAGARPDCYGVPGCSAIGLRSIRACCPSWSVPRWRRWSWRSVGAAQLMCSSVNSRSHRSVVCSGKKLACRSLVSAPGEQFSQFIQLPVRPKCLTDFRNFIVDQSYQESACEGPATAGVLYQKLSKASLIRMSSLGMPTHNCSVQDCHRFFFRFGISFEFEAEFQRSSFNNRCRQEPLYCLAQGNYRPPTFPETSD